MPSNLEKNIREFETKMTQEEYNRKHLITVNLTFKMRAFLKFLKKEKYIKSVSEAVRQMISFAMPFFLNSAEIIESALENDLKAFTFEKPDYEKTTLKALRILHPDLSDYKFPNE